MNEKISDERLKEIKARGNQFVDKSRGSYGIPAIEMEQIIDELLSARETIRRLVENSKALAKSLESEYCNCDNEPCALAYHRELLAELEGNKFETAMKRVLDENIGAWKALGGEEGKG